MKIFTKKNNLAGQKAALTAISSTLIPFVGKLGFLTKCFRLSSTQVEKDNGRLGSGCRICVNAREGE